MGLYKTPFKDSVGVDSVPTKGSHGGKYDYNGNVPDVPGRDGGLLPELHRDTTVSKDPGVSGPYKTPFKDPIGK